jgi:class 3 adenylate cyclase
MDAVGSESAAVFGYSEGGPLAVLFAATYPERVRALVLYGSYAKRRDPDDDYPWAPTWDERLEVARELEETWGSNVDLGSMWPDPDEVEAAWFHRRGRASLSPAGARDLILMNSQVDVRDVLPTIQCPTLVVHRTGDRDAQLDEGRYMAGRIPGARFVELPGDDHTLVADPRAVLDEVEEFLTGIRPKQSSDRVLATILFTDLVGSTQRATQLGDAAWVELLARHDAAVRTEFDRYDGEEIDSAGDGFLALFDGPRVRFAAGSPSATPCGARPRRAGRVHTGEVERPVGAKPLGSPSRRRHVMSIAEGGECS